MTTAPENIPSPSPVQPEPAAHWTPADGDPIPGTSQDGRKVAFNASKHFPRTDSLNRWVNRRTDRAKGSVGQSEGGTPKHETAPDFSALEKLLGDPSAADQPGAGAFGKTLQLDRFTIAAIGTVGGLTSAAILLMGKHTKPTEEETGTMVESYATAYRIYGYAPDTPPWLGPVLATAAWLAPHLQDERSQTALQRFKAKVIGIIAKFRGRSDAKAATRSAQEAGNR